MSETSPALPGTVAKGSVGPMRFGRMNGHHGDKAVCGLLRSGVASRLKLVQICLLGFYSPHGCADAELNHLQAASLGV
jgi:hypothetical protein